ncbi:VanW family protein [Bacillus sp. BRMEA1]|uniref:VanW family protein n=1 Tax=Neobacillus endophyticus TaxID=2738405 RepID=UPI001565A07B|nr:VanW family protein [Neobacillus endophyticus]NRD80018.1 VanW family protein [Neobacillus endophyticus]
MNFTWLLGLFILSQQVYMPQSLEITSNGKPISIVKPTEFPVFPFIHSEKLNTIMDDLDKRVYKEPKNARVDKNGNILPGQPGYRLNRQIFTEKMYSYYFNHSPSKLEVPLLTVYPRVDSELMGNIRSDKIGEYITSFNYDSRQRNNNIYLAAEAINNFVLFPGETFSFNKVVGQRTAEKGYLPARVIIEGEFSDDIGGGICQVSSTLFNAIDNAGLKVLQRSSHSREVSYVPPKRDATVSWNGPDLIFKNEYNQPILIQAKTVDNKLKIEVYSSDVIQFKPKKVPYLPNEQNVPK